MINWFELNKLLFNWLNILDYELNRLKILGLIERILSLDFVEGSLELIQFFEIIIHGPVIIDVHIIDFLFDNHSEFLG